MKFEYLAIIPARGGSKGLPGKNLKKINGKSLVTLAIKEALKVKKINEVIVSTDDIEIYNESKKILKNLEYKRPTKLGQDHSLMIDVVSHVIYSFKQKDVTFKNIILLQPTSPLRNWKDIEKAIEAFEDEKKKTLVSVYREDCELSKMIIKYEDNKAKMLLNFDQGFPRQSLRRCESFVINGAIYITNVKYLVKNKKLICPKDTSLYVMPKKLSVDIDSKKDFEQAKKLSRPRRS